jgi:hypothetical protein
MSGIHGLWDFVVEKKKLEEQAWAFELFLNDF